MEFHYFGSQWRKAVVLHLSTDGSDLIQTLMNSSRPLFGFKFKPSIAEMDNQIGRTRRIVRWAHYNTIITRWVPDSTNQTIFRKAFLRIIKTLYSKNT